MNLINKLAPSFSFWLFFIIARVSIEALPTEAIVGGVEADHHEFKYQISLQFNGKHLCGGAILDDFHVITAAHCVIFEETSHGGILTVVAGTHDAQDKRVTVPVYQIYLLSKHQPNKHYADIAVIQLEQSLNVTDNPNLEKVVLPSDDTSVGKEAVISGFGSISLHNRRQVGQVEKRGIAPQNKLHALNTTIISNNECQGRYLLYKKRYMKEVPLVKIDDTFICVQAAKSLLDPPRGSCSGDSGGPLVTDGNVLIGIVGVGPLNCDEYFAPGAHTRVSKYRRFIHRALIDDCDSPTISTDSYVVCFIT